MAQSKRNQAASGNSMKLFYGLLAAVAVIGIGAMIVSRGGAGEVATEAIDMSQITGDAGSLVSQAKGISLGEENAPAKILVFSDYMCPACGVWAGQIEPFVKRDYVETGKARITYFDFPLIAIHPHSFAAARAARCASDQNQFWAYHDQLFGTQQQWIYSQRLPLDHFLGVGRGLSLDMNQFEDCLRSDQYADVVSTSIKLGEMLGVISTPTVFVNGRALGPAEWNNLGAVQAAIEAAGGT